MSPLMEKPLPDPQSDKGDLTQVGGNDNGNYNGKYNLQYNITSDHIYTYLSIFANNCVRSPSVRA